jgi:hypothetical protein
MNPKRRFTGIACLLLLATSTLAAVNPRIAFTVSIPDAGPMVFDGTYLWVASSNLITAVDPATGAVVVSQTILGTQFMAYDAPNGTLWLEGGLANAQLNKVNAQAIIASNGNAAVDSIAFSTRSPTAMAIDSSASARNVWAAADGTITIIKMDSLAVIDTISTPDGFRVTQINPAASLGAMMVSTSGFAGAQRVANVWIYGPAGAWIRAGLEDQGILSAGAWDGSTGSQFWGDGEGSLYKYAFTNSGQSETVVRSKLHLTDATDNEASHMGAISGLSVYAVDGLALVARQEADVPNQVYFVSVSYGTGAYEVAGLSVPGAALTAFGGGFAWASSPGSEGGVTAIIY